MRMRPKILVLLCLAVAFAAPLPAFAQPSGGGDGGGPGDPGASSPPSPPDTGPPPEARPLPPHETALEAVQSKRALPLADIIARNAIADQVIDAQLITLRGQLVYRLKLLSVSGQLHLADFFADTGMALKGD
ncbi:hypothetical protein GCM10007913_01380 [Devosia yakushimensis]|uniref:PepSY domain-containing protein n=1 Tax=Devosia yakushimensis TaxID=470028 RepID=A0ABQ5U8U2_9HYPH|nr:hypothetical protein [Devosia yakushimensis]GLQ08206.1 hypothetical protein GCM10007913_01380 [Devosia yakushimensis]